MRSTPLFLLLSACIFVDLDLGDDTGIDVPDEDTSVPDTAAPVEVTDVFVHAPAAVDLLFVIDDSCSMADDQLALADSLGPMVDGLGTRGLDYHLGVVTTDMDNAAKQGRLQPDAAGALWTDPTTADPLGNVEARVRVGTTGSGNEKGLEAARAALEDHDPGANSGFRRTEAQLALLALTDERDASPLSPAQYADLLLAAVPTADDVTFSSFVGTGIGGCGDPGTRYTRVTDELGGVVAEVCDPDLSDDLEAMLALVWDTAPLPLSATPDPATIEVRVDGAPLDPSAWVHEPVANTVRIRTVGAGAGATIEIGYQPM